MAVNMMLILLGLVGMLGLVEIGYLYWAKRDTQKVADLASLAGAQQLQDCGAGNTSNSAAYGNAAVENHFLASGLTITCGTWDPVANAGIADHFSTSASGASTNAVKVVAERSVAPLFAFTSSLPGVSTEAVATNATPVAAFSVGTTLVDVNSAAALPQFLQSIGLGNLSGTSLVGYQGLANVYITPSGLLQQLGIAVPTNLTVGQLNTLLSAQTNAQALLSVLNAIVTVGGQQNLTSANVGLVNAIDAAVGNVPLNVALGSSGSTPSGLFAQVVGPDSSADAALDTQVNALQLLNAAIGVATMGHAITAQSINLSFPSSANPLITLTAATSVIEPPSIGIGGVGTTAYTAQIRTFIDITTPNRGNVSLLGGAIMLNINLPIVIDLADAQAELASLCDTTDSAGNPQATINVSSSVLMMCVGDYTEAEAFSTTTACNQMPGASTPQPVFSVTAGNTTLASLSTAFATSALTGSGSVTLSAGESANTGDALNIGSSVDNLVGALTAALVANASTQTSSSASGIANQLASDLWNATSTSDSYPQRAQQALQQIQAASQTLQTALDGVTSNSTALLGNAVQLNVSGLLGNVGGVLGNVNSLLSGILTNLGCTLGSQAACTAVIGSGLSGGGSGTSSNAFAGLIGFLLQALQTPLNDIGSQLDTFLQNTLGLQLGVNTVTLHSLQCHRVQLVY